MNPVFSVLTINDGTNTVRIDCKPPVTFAWSNPIIAVAKPLSYSKQNGSTAPSTIVVDLKRIKREISAGGVLTDDTAESGASPATKKGYLEDMIYKKAGPFTVTYRGTSLGAKWFITDLQIKDTQDQMPSSTGARTNTVEYYEVSIKLLYGDKR